MANFLKTGLVVVIGVTLVSAQLQDKRINQMTIGDLLSLISSKQQQKTLNQMTIGELLSTQQQNPNRQRMDQSSNTGGKPGTPPDVMNNKLSNPVQQEHGKMLPNDPGVSKTNTVTTTKAVEKTTPLQKTTTKGKDMQKSLGKMTLFQLLSSVSKNKDPKKQKIFGHGFSMIPKFVLNGAASQWIPPQYQQKIINSVIKGQKAKASPAL